MKRTIRAIAAAVLATTALALVPATAGAVTASGADPTGDVTAGPSYDITRIDVTLTTSTLTIGVQFAGVIPALADSSWLTTNHEGRYVGVSLGDSIGGGYYVDGDGAVPYSSFGGEITSSDCTVPTVTGYTTNTLTFTAQAKCFSYPGKVEVEAIAASASDPVAGQVDAAIAPTVTAFPFDVTTTHINPVTAALPGGYYQLGADGGIFAFGDAGFYGSTGNIHLNSAVVAMSAQPAGNGYRFVAGDGGVFAYGSSGFYGSMGGKHLNKPIVGMATTQTGNGYWLVASDGGIFAYGDANFYGSMGGSHLNKPIVGMASTSTGHGYWLIASDGGIFAYGDANFYGSTGAIKLNSPIVGAVPTTTGQGYWLAASDGGIFAYGDATFYGSGVDSFSDNVVGIARPASGPGYYLVGDDGSLVNYGTALDFGDMFRLSFTTSSDLNSPMVGLSTTP